MSLAQTDVEWRVKIILECHSVSVFSSSFLPHAQHRLLSPPGITTGAMVCCRLPEGGPGPVGATAGVGVALLLRLATWDSSISWLIDRGMAVTSIVLLSHLLGHTSNILRLILCTGGTNPSNPGNPGDLAPPSLSGCPRALRGRLEPIPGIVNALLTQLSRFSSPTLG